MAIEQRADYSAIQYTRKRLMMRLGMPRRNHLVALGKAANVQPFFIRGPATETDAIG